MKTKLDNVLAIVSWLPIIGIPAAGWWMWRKVDEDLDWDSPLLVSLHAFVTVIWFGIILFSFK